MSTPPDLGPLPEPLKPMEWQQFMWTAAQVEAERQRCYMLGVAAASQWRPIETAPRLGRTMYVVRGFFVTNVNAHVRDYTTDAYCVWPDPDGGWVRWPHTFPPTHWKPLPSAPTKEGG